MDVKINAQGRYVEVTGIETDDWIQALGEIYALWEETDPNKETTEISAGTGSHIEKSYGKIGFAFMGDGERPEIR